MNDDAWALLVDARLTQGGIRSLSSALPPDDATLERWIEYTLESGEERPTTALLLTIAAAGREIDARYLPQAVPLLRNPGDMIAAITHSRGEVVDALMQVARSGAVGWERHAVLLLLIGWVSKHRTPDGPPPDDLIPLARKLAREIGPSPLDLLPLFSLANMFDSQELHSVLKSQMSPPEDERLLALLPESIHMAAEDPVAHLPEQADTVLHEGGTIRRAAAKVGRNDPCPCGSGKKYKRCCFEADQERLRHSSPVAGKTAAELIEEPEPFLTETAVMEMRGPKLARLRIDRVAESLQGLLLERLALFGQVDPLIAGWEQIGWREDLERAWEASEMHLVRMQRSDALARLCAVRGWDAHHPELSFSTKALLLKDQPAVLFQQAEACALASLKDPKDTEYIDVAYGLMESEWPGLGTLLARGAATTCSPFDSMMLFDTIQAVRDRLNLSPDDPAEWIQDRDYATPDHLGEAERRQFESAREELALSAGELGRLRGRLKEARAELERKEKLAQRRKDAQEPRPAEPSTVAEEATQDLRRRIANLKVELDSRRQERSVLRQKLAEAIQEAEDLRHRIKPKDEAVRLSTAPSDTEEDCFLAEEPLTHQPPRLPAFPTRFEHGLKALPAGVVRSSLVLIGKLAAGDPGAFAGSRRLRRDRTIQRIRVGSAHRLFFRAEGDRLEVLDLIARRDFDRWLKERV